MQKKQPEDKIEVLFLVSPNLGLLDNWLPVLLELRKKRPDITITALFPKPETVSEINPNEMMVQIGASIFDRVIFRSRAGLWTMADSLTHAKKLKEESRVANLVIGKMRTALRLAGRSALIRPVTQLLDMILGYSAAMWIKGKHIPLKKIGINAKAICFDTYAKTKQECHDILDHFPNTPRFSIWHGVGITDFKVKGGDYDRGYKAYRTTAYLYSEHERAAHSENYGLKEDEIKVVGVPRYESEWIEEILTNSKKDIPASWNRYLFVISRPATTHFFSREKKIEALEHIKKLAFQDLHCKIVIKLRLSEYTQKDGTYEEVLGEDSYGKDWIYSSSHPFILGKDSLFGITFYSGVAIDLLAIGVPSIQMIDLQSGGKTGVIMEYKKKGLVLGGDSYEELKENARNILGKNNSVLTGLTKRYNEYFRPIGKPISIIVDDIIEVL